MKVLMITGDKKFGPGHPRFELQKSAVEDLQLVYWGRGSVLPKIPKGHFDVVTAQDPFWRGLFAWRVARKLRAKLNVQVHTDLVASTKRASQKSSAAPRLLSGMLRLHLANFVLRHAYSVRVVSEKIKEQVESMGVRAPIAVLPVFIDVEKFRNVVPKPHEQKTILWLGRFEQEKDPLAAIEVLKQVRDVKLVMLGGGGLEHTLRSSAKSLPVEFPGWQDPASYLEVADVVLCTSRHESYGASIVEALAAGVPVVAPDVGVAREAGAIVVPREKLAEKVIEVLQSGVRGELKISLLNKEEWVKKCRESLI